jgi:hypothetical protein
VSPLRFSLIRELTYSSLSFTLRNDSIKASSPSDSAPLDVPTELPTSRGTAQSQKLCVCVEFTSIWVSG